MDQIECARERQPKHARAIGRNEAYGSVWEHVSTVLAVAVLMMCRGLGERDKLVSTQKKDSSRQWGGSGLVGGPF
jgi:hypothetical protein